MSDRYNLQSMPNRYGVSSYKYGINEYSYYTRTSFKNDDYFSYTSTIDDVQPLEPNKYSFTPHLSLSSRGITQYMDKVFAPDYYKNVGSVGITQIDSSTKVMYRLDRVEDIESCGQYYHRNGYLVNEYINDARDIFSYVNTRYYYNILKLSDADIHMKNTIESAELIEEIKSRLYKGLRLWNYKALTSTEGTATIEIGDFSYDNVEKSYITQ